MRRSPYTHTAIMTLRRFVHGNPIRNDGTYSLWKIVRGPVDRNNKIAAIRENVKFCVHYSCAQIQCWIMQIIIDHDVLIERSTLSKSICHVYNNVIFCIKYFSKKIFRRIVCLRFLFRDSIFMEKKMKSSRWCTRSVLYIVPMTRQHFWPNESSDNKSLNLKFVPPVFVVYLMKGWFKNIVFFS